MVAQYRQLQDMGVPEERIEYEFFGKSQSLPALVAEQIKEETSDDTPTRSKRAGANAPPSLAGLEHLTDPDAWAMDDPSVSAFGVDTEASTTEVMFSRSAVSAQWSDTTKSLLELAEQQGLEPEFSCRAGICGTCVCAISEGEVEYFEQPLEIPEAGHVLICCSRPKSRVVLDL